MFLRESRILINHIVPVDIVDTVAITIVPGYTVLRTDSVNQLTIGSTTCARTYWCGLVILLDSSHTLGIEEYRLTLIGLGIVQPRSVVNRVHHVLATNQVAETEAVVIVNLYLAILATVLSGNQDNTERCTATID